MFMVWLVTSSNLCLMLSERLDFKAEEGNSINDNGHEGSRTGNHDNDNDTDSGEGVSGRTTPMAAVWHMIFKVGKVSLSMAG
jgi:hypothetical protein